MRQQDFRENLSNLPMATPSEWHVSIQAFADSLSNLAFLPLCTKSIISHFLEAKHCLWRETELIFILSLQLSSFESLDTLLKLSTISFACLFRGHHAHPLGLLY